MMNAYPGQTWRSEPYVDAVSSRSSCWDMNAPSQRPVDAFDDARQRTQQPIVTGTSVLGLLYKDGVMLATDTLASYGSLARFMNIQRLEAVGQNTVIGASGDMSDWQNIQHTLTKLIEKEEIENDGHALTPAQVYAYLSRTMYERRSKLDPYWNALVLGGFDSKTNKPFLGYVDLLGTTYQSSTIATGFGLHLAQPMLRKAVEGKEATLTEEEARSILEDCMRVLFYRDARSLNRFQVAKVTNDGVHISEPYSVSTEWGFAEGLRGYGPQTQ
ncbi:Proteasome subunit beta type-7 [Malassezia pachydermatis]|uniref:Proteasome subunit beta n=1 Tax=Malassezia pachydermatis TaxID=77020 RepID=A0A0M8MIS0_9BASI|nr:proteasome endopeptidase complex beta subunit [Malassezia pachydermatis]KOS13296.1 proteasome endopeptidase complex beta subunit [Malassezia pachydermatis]